MADTTENKTDDRLFLIVPPSQVEMVQKWFGNGVRVMPSVKIPTTNAKLGGRDCE